MTVTLFRSMALALALMALGACATPDLSKFGDSMTALSEASLASQREIASSASDVADVLAYIESSNGDGVCDPAADNNSPSACARALKEQAKELKQAFILIQAYSNAVGNLSRTAGTGEESLRGICSSVVTAVNALGGNLGASDCTDKSESTASTAGSLVDIGAALAGAFSSYQGNKGLEEAMGKADPIIGVIAAKASQAASVQESLIESFARVLRRDAEAKIDDYVLAREAIIVARSFNKGAISGFVSDFLADDNMSNRLSSFCLGASDVNFLKKESHPIFRYLRDDLDGVTISRENCPNGFVLNVPSFLNNVAEAEAQRQKSLNDIEALLDHAAANIQLERIAQINQWEQKQLAQIGAIPKIAIAWRTAHAEALAHAKTCSKFTGVFKNKCGALTFENLQLLGKALSLTVGGPFAMVPDILGSK